MAIHSKLPALVQRCVAWCLGLVLALTAAAALAQGAPPISGAMANFTLNEGRPPAPDIRFFDGAGKALSLADFKGKVVLLNFWATWCAPCRREMGDLDKLEGELGGKKFTVLALSSDRQGFKVVDKFYGQEKLNHLARYNDKTIKAQRAFRVLGLPTSFLIDAKGRIAGKLVGAAEWSAPEAVALMRHYISMN